MVFTCKDKSEKWQGEITRFIPHGSHFEILIQSRSSILVLLGSYSHGNFACMPSFNAGCFLAELNDLFWNTEKLISVMGEIDGITVASAIYHLADIINPAS